MELTPQPRHPGEVFHFTGSILVADEAAVYALGPVPRVEVCDGNCVVGTIERADGTVQARDFITFEGNTLYGGQRLLRVQAGSERSVLAWTEEGRRTYAVGGETTAEHIVQPEDKLIVVQSDPRSEEPEGIIIVSAAEPMPAEADVSYTPLGIITGDGRLIAFGYRSHDTRRVVDLAIASKLVSSAVDLLLLEEQIGAGHLVGILQCSEAATTYLQWFAAQYGNDFMPTQDVRERYDEFPEPLTRAQKDRYFSS
jgi:hypothetical protein